MAEYKISDDGTIVYEDRVSLSSEKTPEEEMYAEYNKLVYDVIDHPERFTTAEIVAKKQRMKEIEESGVKLNNDKALKFKMARIPIKQQPVDGANVLTAHIAKFKKEND